MTRSSPRHVGYTPDQVVGLRVGETERLTDHQVNLYLDELRDGVSNEISISTRPMNVDTDVDYPFFRVVI